MSKWCDVKTSLTLSPVILGSKRIPDLASYFLNARFINKHFVYSWKRKCLIYTGWYSTFSLVNCGLHTVCSPIESQLQQQRRGSKGKTSQTVVLVREGNSFLLLSTESFQEPSSLEWWFFTVSKFSVALITFVMTHFPSLFLSFCILLTFDIKVF